jgi:hypothetical protein
MFKMLSRDFHLFLVVLGWVDYYHLQVLQVL